MAASAAALPAPSAFTSAAPAEARAAAGPGGDRGGSSNGASHAAADAAAEAHATAAGPQAAQFGSGGKACCCHGLCQVELYPYVRRCVYCSGLAFLVCHALHQA